MFTFFFLFSKKVRKFIYNAKPKSNTWSIPCLIVFRDLTTTDEKKEWNGNLQDSKSEKDFNFYNLILAL